jgi:ankyrin repeat protein
MAGWWHEEAVHAIHRAITAGNAEAVARLLDQDPRLLGYSLLTEAAYERNVGILELLLERGADVNIDTDADGNSALHLAAYYGHEEMVSTLLSSGADVYRRNPSGDTALLNASERGHVAVVRLLVRSMGGCGLNEQDRYERTALWWACYGGYADVVRALLLAGADHTIADHDGWTPQHIAQDRGHPECAALIQVSNPFTVHEQQPHHGAIDGYSVHSLYRSHFIYTLSLCCSGGRASWRVPMSSTRPGRYTMTPPRTSKPLQPQCPPI